MSPDGNYLQMFFEQKVKPMLKIAEKFIPLRTIGAAFVGYGISLMRGDGVTREELQIIIDEAWGESSPN